MKNFSNVYLCFVICLIVGALFFPKPCFAQQVDDAGLGAESDADVQQNEDAEINAEASTDADISSELDGDALAEADGDAEQEPAEPPIPPERLPTVEVTIEEDEVELGQVVSLVINLTYELGDRVQVRNIRDLGEFELIGRSRVTPEEGEENVGEAETITLELISFEVGEFEVPPIELTVVTNDGRTGTVSTPAMTVRVSDPLANESDPQPKENPEPISVLTKDRRAMWAGIIFGSLLLAVLLGYTIRALSRRRKPRPGPPPPPPRPAEEIALEKLEKIERTNWLKKGKIEKFHVAVSEASREYLGNRYGFDSLELTTSQLLRQLEKITLRGVSLTELQEFLRETDLVKFAKWRPDDAKSREILAQAFKIVRRTTEAEALMVIPKIEPQQNTESEDESGGQDEKV